MSINVKLLKEICETAGISGFEQPIREVILREVTPLVDEVKIDNMGNVWALKKGRDSSKKVMLAAHMDEIGFVVTHIDSEGFLRFHPVGGFDPKTLTSQRVIIHGKRDIIGVMGAKPIHLMTPEEKVKPVKISDFFIDTGLPKAEVEKIVEIGTPITRQRDLIEMGECVNGKSIDNRVSVFILIELLREVSSLPFDTYGVFTVQEEVGLRGAVAAGMGINPDFGFCIDTTIAFDVPPAAEEEKVTRLGKGVAIKIMDKSAICDYRMVRYMKKMAVDHQIPWQAEVLTRGGTDTASMQRMNPGGSITGAVSIPTRHIHQVIEMAHKRDIRATIDLLKVCVDELPSYDFSFR